MGTELVPVSGCPVCGGRLNTFTCHEEPLIRGGGYGEARETDRDLCAYCGFEIQSAVRSVRPDRRTVRV